MAVTQLSLKYSGLKAAYRAHYSAQHYKTKNDDHPRIKFQECYPDPHKYQKVYGTMYQFKAKMTGSVKVVV